MANFSRERNGYAPSEVDAFLEKLKLENEEKLREQRDTIFELKAELGTIKRSLSGFESKETQISSALVSAVEKAREIEESARTLYELEIKRVRILYRKWETLLEKLTAKYGKGVVTDEIALLLDEFQVAIKTTLSTGQAQVVSQQDKSYAKTLLTKMGGVPAVAPQAGRVTAETRLGKSSYEPRKAMAEQDVKTQYTEEVKRLSVKKTESGTVATQTQSQTSKKGPSLADEFLGGDDASLPKMFGQSSKSNAFFDAIVPPKPVQDYLKEKNEGFDLREAVNPTESLEEIMKAFDFYEDGQKV